MDVLAAGLGSRREEGRSRSRREVEAEYAKTSDQEAFQCPMIP